jgi:phage host-nuclease inhibitor protein Gam
VAQKPESQADDLLLTIRKQTNEIERLHNAYTEAVDALAASYKTKVDALQELLKDNDAALKALMKRSKKELFAGADIVNLPHGSLLHSIADKVKIPKTALDRCEELGFAEVVKIAKSLDREAVEKWPDEKLFLIGAERKPKEEFSYDLKKEANDVFQKTYAGRT